MHNTIDYYYYSASPFTYLGHQAILNVAEKHGAVINFKPVNLFGIWEISGAVPPAKRPPVRQRYRMLELQRAREIRNLPLNLTPKYFPVDATLADNVGCGYWKAKILQNILAFVALQFGLIIVIFLMKQQYQSCLKLLALPQLTLLNLAKEDATAKLRAKNTQDAIDSDAVGVPAYVLNGEVFWGQDRY